MAEINFSKQALNDIDEIALYRARFSEKTAKTYIQKIYATIELLAQFPHLGKMSPKLDYPTVREIYAGPYRVFATLALNNVFRLLQYITVRFHSTLTN